MDCEDLLQAGSACISRRRLMQAALGAAITRPALSQLARAQQEVVRDPGPEVQGLNYHPAGMYVWDSWYFVHGEAVHVIHLQKPRPGSTRPERDGRSLGHAVSEEFLTWKELPPALYPGPEQAVDDLDLFTGCTITHGGTHFLFYTARKRAEEGRVQRLCLATSVDALTWTKHGTAVIVPAPEWYQEGDCRDLMVVLEPETQIFHGFFTARVGQSSSGLELSESAVVAHATSHDLIHWKQGPPVFAPGAYGILEEPDVFFLGGRWWMICATGNFDGVRGDYRDPEIIYGTIYASSPRIEGPYVLGKETLLLGGSKFNGFSCRTVSWKGKRYAMYTQAERRDRGDGNNPTLGCLTSPKEVTVVGDRLCLTYSPLIEVRAGNSLLRPASKLPLDAVPYKMSDRRFGTGGDWSQGDDAIRAESPRSWSVRTCGSGGGGFILKAQLTVDRGRAIGLLFHGTLAVLLDLHSQCVAAYDLPDFIPIERRKIALLEQHPYSVRVLAKNEFFEVYLDDILVLNFVRYRPTEGYFGLYIEAGAGRFRSIEAVSLNV